MKIALSAPADLRAIAAHLGQVSAEIPAGLGSSAVTPLVLRLLDRRHHVQLFTLSHDVNTDQHYRWDNCEVFVGRALKKHMTRSIYAGEIAYLRRAIRQVRPTFVNAHWTYEFALGSIAAGVPTLVTIHDLPWNVLRFFRDGHRSLRLAMAYAVAAQCRRYTAVSTDAARHFRRYLRPGAEIDVIPNFCGDNLLELPFRSCPSGSSLSFATVLQGWTRQKNGRSAIRAFQILRNDFPNTRLLMFGDGYASGEEAHAWAVREGLAQNVSFLGRLPYDQLIAALNEQVDVLLHPSLNEAFSLTILDAMGMGKAIIAGQNTPGVAQMLSGDAGILVNVRKPAAIVEAMRQFCNAPARVATLGIRARNKTAEEYSAKRVVEAYERAYRGFLETASPAS